MSRPTLPALVFDDDCGFCTWWAEFFEERTDVRIVGFTDLTPALRARLPEEYEDCSHLVTYDEVYSCGQSLEEGVARLGDEYGVTREAVEFLRNFEDYERLRERGYREVANNRDFWGTFLSKTPPVRRE
jgi:predicted DCC family thiol-disulfide oxidoreductase YuxK